MEKLGYGIFAILSIGIFTGCESVQDTFEARVSARYHAQDKRPGSILLASDLRGLPRPVQQYLVYTGSLGKAKIHAFHAVLSAEMFKKPGSHAMQATAEQFNFLVEPARFFFMKARTFGLPVRVLHAYQDQEATMLVRVAGLFNAVDLSGEELTRTETVTLFNDMCFFAPATLIDPRISWQSRDSLSAIGQFTNGRYTIAATLFFNAQGELILFESEDRGALQDDGSLLTVKWSTPMGAYQEIDGRKLATYGEAIYHYPKGDHLYAKFTLKSISYPF